MELYKEILIKALEGKSCSVTISNFLIDATAIVHLARNKALTKIRRILSDDSLNDSECFSKIEEIVQSFESLGLNCKNPARFLNIFGYALAI